MYFVVRCTVASAAFAPTGLTFKIAQLCMNGKQYPLPSGPAVTYFISEGVAEHNHRYPPCNYDLLKMIPNTLSVDLWLVVWVQTRRAGSGLGSSRLECIPVSEV